MHGGSSPTAVARVLEELQPQGEVDLTKVSEKFTRDKGMGYVFGNHPSVAAEEATQFRDMVEQERDAFAFSLAELTGYNGPCGPVEIKLVHDQPLWEAARRQSPLEKEVSLEKCGELGEVGFIEDGNYSDPYAANPVNAAKKDAQGEWTEKRFCVNYKRVNLAQQPNKYRTPSPEELFQRLSGATFFSHLDMRAGFHQLPLAQSSRKYTQFWAASPTGPKLMRYTRLPFGGINCSAEFQRRADDALIRAGLGHCACAYVDDIIIWSRTFKEHLQHVRAVLRALKAVGFKVHPSKSVFLCDGLPFLGHYITPDGRKPDEAKVAAMMSLPVPRNLKELQTALGVLNYYRVYCPDYSTIAAPLHALLRKDVSFNMSPAAIAAFEQLKAEIAKPGNALRHPDPDKPFIVHTDWSQLGIGGVLGQLDDAGKEYIVACVSRSCNEHERRYTPWKGEALAATWVLAQFKPYLQGTHFLLVTDHRPLLHLLKEARTGDDTSWRWVHMLQGFSFDIVHRAGKKHLNADALSRFPQSSTLDVSGAQIDLEGQPVPRELPRVLMPDGTFWQPTLDSIEDPSQWEAELQSCPVGVAAVLALYPADGVAWPTLAACSLEAVLTLPGPHNPIDDHIPHAYDLMGGNHTEGAVTLNAATAAAVVARVLPDLARRRKHSQALAQRAAGWLMAAQRKGLPPPAHPLGGTPLTLGGCKRRTIHSSSTQPPQAPPFSQEPPATASPSMSPLGACARA